MNKKYFEEKEEIKEINGVPVIKKKEANAIFWVPKANRIYDAPAFFNPLMGLNRDFSLVANSVVIREIGKPVFVYEPLAGIGVRGVRNLLSLKNQIDRYVSNDINPIAASIAKANALENKVNLEVTLEDARWQIAEFRKSDTIFPNVIDLDPFGSPTPFLDALSYGFSRNSYLYVTATDMAPLCGVYPETCFIKYHSYPLRIYQCHEVAVRILFYTVALTAARRGYGIKPLFSYSTDHYIRIGIKLEKGKEKAKNTLKNTGFIYYSLKTDHFYITDFKEQKMQGKLRMDSDKTFEKVGPIWTGKLGDENFLSEMIKNAEKLPLYQKDRFVKIATTLVQEINAPLLFYRTDKVAKGISGNLPPKKLVIKKLRERGFKAVETHFHSQGIKTDADYEQFRQILSELIHR